MTRKKSKGSDAGPALAPSDPLIEASGSQPEMDLAPKPDLDEAQVLVMNDKKFGYIFLPGAKVGPGERALCDRKIAAYMIAKGVACHIVRDPDSE